MADAVVAMKSGAADYLIKPISKDELLVVVERALELAPGAFHGLG